jgi:hypothetical protein
MNKLLTLLALGCSLSLGVAHAATSPAQAAQQNKMTTCNADAKTQNLKGDARKAFMKTCLSGKTTAADTTAKPAAAAAKPATPAAAPVAAAAKPVAVAAVPAAAAAKPATVAVAPVAAQQTKMKTCNADAKTKNLAGDARKQFMSSCLKN